MQFDTRAAKEVDDWSARNLVMAFIHPKRYDVIVVGAGHAGIEAALASARMGCQTLLLTINADTIGQMSCNPAIGGLAKGHLVREIDALGGEMGKCTDMTGLQFRMLNTKKGPSVWAPRAQCDKKAYQFRMKWVCERTENLDIRQGQTTKLLFKHGQVCGVGTALDVEYNGHCVVVTTGTFLRGLMHIGSNQQKGGRAGEASAMSLSDSLKEAGLELGRLKTGTPPRLLKKTIDFSKTHIQPGDEPAPLFTYWRDDLFHVEQAGMSNDECRMTKGSTLPNMAACSFDRYFPTKTFPGMFHMEQAGLSSSVIRLYPPGSILAQIGCQLPCYITFTSDRTAEVIRANLNKSPMYSGIIEGVGPRYCPSIEDKIVKFADKERHQVFLEPEGIATDEIYVNGFSTCLPYEVQVDLVRTIIGCENAEILRPAYAVEYDFSFPTQLLPSLETKACGNLFLAGQINGTSGYEEAAAQGLMAGINAARRVQGKGPVILRRDQAYIGVLIDDLVTKGTLEPYRMFTSRAEYRLLLRQDNADLRLCEVGHGIGLLPDRNYQKFVSKRDAIAAETSRLNQTRSGQFTLAQLLRRPEISHRDLPGTAPGISEEVALQVEIAMKYEGYIQREETEVARFRQMEDKQIPAWLDYAAVPSLRSEARQKLSKTKPITIGQASRISGISPSDISILLIWLKRGPSIPDESPNVCAAEENLEGPPGHSTCCGDL
jgi:tRNA uridine 5-carboxymethylaminomethyl modification enzyme